MLGGMKMINELNGQVTIIEKDGKAPETYVLFSNLRGDASALNKHDETNLMQCATMAQHHGRLMGMQSQEAFDALALICLVLGERRQEFFGNAFLKRMMMNTKLAPSEKLNRIIELVIGIVPPMLPMVSNDNNNRESA